jgi:puromycin-sensitive aminopeptidase
LQPLLESQQVDGEPTLRKRVFARTPKMSTYLLAFVVGEFDYIEDTDKNGILIRVYAPVGKKEFGRFALDVGLLATT